MTNIIQDANTSAHATDEENVDDILCGYDDAHYLFVGNPSHKKIFFSYLVFTITENFLEENKIQVEMHEKDSAYTSYDIQLPEYMSIGDEIYSIETEDLLISRNIKLYSSHIFLRSVKAVTIEDLNDELFNYFDALQLQINKQVFPQLNKCNIYVYDMSVRLVTLQDLTLHTNNESIKEIERKLKFWWNMERDNIEIDECVIIVDGDTCRVAGFGPAYSCRSKFCDDKFDWLRDQHLIKSKKLLFV